MAVVLSPADSLFVLELKSRVKEAQTVEDLKLVLNALLDFAEGTDTEFIKTEKKKVICGNTSKCVAGYTCYHGEEHNRMDTCNKKCFCGNYDCKEVDD